MQGGAALHALDTEIQKTLVRAGAIAELSNYATALGLAFHRLVAVTEQLHAAGDLNKTLANASLYLEAFGHGVVAWMWLEQALHAVGKSASHDADFYRGKLQACSYFFQWELPKIHPQIDLLSRLDTTTLDMQNDWF